MYVCVCVCVHEKLILMKIYLCNEFLEVRGYQVGGPRPTANGEEGGGGGETAPMTCFSARAGDHEVHTACTHERGAREQSEHGL